MQKLIITLAFSLILAGCESAKFSDNRAAELDAADAILKQVDKNATASGIRFAFNIDHSRLAEEAGEVLDASRVSFFTNPKVNSQILDNEIRAGLDLPYRIQVFYHQKRQQVLFTNADFIKIRHGLKNLPVLKEFDRDISKLTEGL